MFKDSLFNKIEKKTSINKETIMNLANKIQKNNMKDEKTLREVIQDLSNLTGKEVSKEKEDKIINAIINDQVPNNVDKLF
ncbi:MAG: stage VI sporulation protein F [Bacilli bacterium]|nr:stage VI sporulation protein F [Bacilli bacterium]